MEVEYIYLDTSKEEHDWDKSMITCDMQEPSEVLSINTKLSLKRMMMTQRLNLTTRIDMTHI